MQKIFVLGLGAQKSGSSWLQAYLSDDPAADFGRLGEYQIWESVFLPQFKRYRVARPALRRRVTARLMEWARRPVHADVLRWRMQQDLEYYFDYFAARLVPEDTRLTGDVTPSYAALGPVQLAAIKQGFADRHIAVRAIYIMRDPVERIRSHFDMEIRKSRIIAPHSSDYDIALLEFARGDEAALRADYAQTLNNLHECFAPDALYLALFEELFSAHQIEALSRFFDVTCRPEAGNTQVNAQKRVRSIDPGIDAQIAAHYTNQYKAVAQYFPQIRSLWPSAKFIFDQAKI